MKLSLSSRTIWLDRETVRGGRDGPVVAVHAGRGWVLEAAAVIAYFESRRAVSLRTLGPFERLSIVDGIAYGDGRIVAHLDERGWFCGDLRERWPVLVLQNAPGAFDAPEIGMIKAQRSEGSS